MVISSARVIWLISWATRCETGACEVTQGHEAASADVSAAALTAEPWLAAAVGGAAAAATAPAPPADPWRAPGGGGTASSPPPSPAVSRRDFLDKTRQTRAL